MSPRRDENDSNPQPGTLTTAMRLIKTNSPGAEGVLYLMCRHQMVRIVRSQFRGALPLGDHEDVISEAFFDVLQQIRSAPPGRLNHSEDFWKLFRRIAHCKFYKLRGRPRGFTRESLETLVRNPSTALLLRELWSRIDVPASHRARMSRSHKRVVWPYAESFRNLVKRCNEPQRQWLRNALKSENWDEQSPLGGRIAALWQEINHKAEGWNKVAQAHSDGEVEAVLIDEIGQSGLEMVEFRDIVDALNRKLSSHPKLLAVLERKLQGCSNNEIAESLGCTPRYVIYLTNALVEHIRDILGEEDEDES